MPTPDNLIDERQLKERQARLASLLAKRNGERPRAPLSPNLALHGSSLWGESG